MGVGRLICSIAGWPRCCCATVAVWHCVLVYALHHSTDYGCLRLFISFGNCMSGRSAKNVSPLFEAYLCATRKWVLARDSFQLHEQHVYACLRFRWSTLAHSPAFNNFLYVVCSVEGSSCISHVHACPVLRQNSNATLYVSHRFVMSAHKPVQSCKVAHMHTLMQDSSSLQEHICGEVVCIAT